MSRADVPGASLNHHEADLELEQSARAIILVQQRRWDLAEEELRRLLALDPDDAGAHALLALCLAHFQDFTAAQRHADTAVRLAPDLAFAHNARAAVLAERGKLKEALLGAEEAIRLEPDNADYFGLLARLCLLLDRRVESQAAAEAGLRLDPEQVACTNVLAALHVLAGRLDDAQRMLDRALALAPEDSDTHANRGWLALRRGNAGESLFFLREALRLDPRSEWARLGLAEAIKARHGAYAVLLRGALWLLTAGRGVRLAIGIGVLVGFIGAAAGLGAAAMVQPASRPWVWPALLLLLLVVSAYPLSNLLLLRDPFGRLLLKQDQVDEVYVLIGLFVVEALCGLAIVAGQASALYLTIASACVAPLVWYTFRTPAGWPRAVVAGYTVGEALLGLWTLTGLVYGMTLSPARARLFAPIWLFFFVLVLLGPLPGMWLAEHLQQPYSFARRLGRRVPWPAWLAAP